MKLLKITFIAVFALISLNSYSQNALSNAEIASVAVVANKIDINYAKIAIKRSNNDEILEFANRMVTDHNNVIDQAVALVTKLGVKPEDNPVSQSLLESSNKKIAELENVSSSKFDDAYITNEIEYHKQVIAAVENKLVPESTNAQLKDLLQQVLPALKAHLGHAEMVKSKL